MRLRIALLCLFASLLAGVALAATGAPTAPSAPEALSAPAPTAPTFLLSEVEGSGGFVWQTLITCDFKMDLCASRCGGEVDCLTRCYCAWYRCNGLPYPDWC